MKVQVGTHFALGLGGGTGKRGELSASFVDLINSGDLNYLAKNKAQVKKPGSYRLQISNPQISVCMFMQPDSRFLSPSRAGALWARLLPLPREADNCHRKVGMAPSSTIS